MLFRSLKYEQAAYEDATRRMPRNESFVDTPDGVGNVSGVDLLQEQVQVRLDSAPESPRRYKVGEIRVLRSGKGSREGIEIPKDRPARLTPEEPSGGLESRFVRRPGREPVSIPSVLAAEPAKEDRRNDRRRNNNNNNNRGRGRNNERSRQQQEKPGAQAKPQRQERPARAEKAEKVEKLPVRPAVDTTAEKKAAADRAAARQQGEQPRQENKNNNYRRFRRRPRNNNQ